MVNWTSENAGALYFGMEGVYDVKMMMSNLQLKSFCNSFGFVNEKYSIHLKFCYKNFSLLLHLCNRVVGGGGEGWIVGEMENQNLPFIVAILSTYFKAMTHHRWSCGKFQGHSRVRKEGTIHIVFLHDGVIARDG